MIFVIYNQNTKSKMIRLSHHHVRFSPIDPLGDGHGDDIAAAIETYNLMSEKWFTHATPTLFNAGTPRPQLSSCFLVQMQEVP